MKKAYLYGKEIEEIVGYLTDDVVIVHCVNEKYNFIGMKEDIVIAEVR